MRYKNPERFMMARNTYLGATNAEAPAAHAKAITQEVCIVPNVKLSEQRNPEPIQQCNVLRRASGNEQSTRTKISFHVISQPSR